ncbi:hypothetical protein [Rosettibacter firmus]|uniref:hypothetical protein n=1 Tax=Rosettibacter firmus TaxID=3111522 RepID=UPI00336C1497
MARQFLHIKYLFIFCFLIYETTFAQLIVSKLRDLAFGDVFKGYSSTVSHLDVNAAKFYFNTGNLQNVNILVQFVLPSYLTNNIDNLTITFSTQQSAWARRDLTTGRTNFDPYQPLTFNRLKKNTNIYIWLGATITIPVSISSGLYSGTIIMNVERI